MNNPEQIQPIYEYTNEINNWIKENTATHEVSAYFQFIKDIRSDVKDQIYLATSSNEYWKDWGYSYWVTTGNALKKCYSPKSKDLCLSHFGSEKAKQMYEDFSKKYESMPLIEPTGYSGSYGSYGSRYGGGGGIPQAQAVVLTTAHFNDRDAGCFHPHSTFELWEQQQVDFAYLVQKMKENKEIWLIGKNNQPVKVETIIRTPRKNKLTEFCKFHDTVLTPTHPIYENKWSHPKDLTPVFREEVDFVFNLVLAIHPLSGKRDSSVYVNGTLCVCLGHGITDGSAAEDPFWGTERVIDEYKRLYPEKYAYGYIENATPEMIRDPKTGNVIGFK